MARQRIAVTIRPTPSRYHPPTSLAHYLEVETNLKRAPGKRPRVDFFKYVDSNGKIKRPFGNTFFLDNSDQTSQAADWFKTIGKPKSTSSDTAYILWRVKLCESLRHYYYDIRDYGLLNSADADELARAVDSPPLLRGLCPSLTHDATRNHLDTSGTVQSVVSAVMTRLLTPLPSRTELEMANWNMSNSFVPEEDPFDVDDDDED